MSDETAPETPPKEEKRQDRRYPVFLPRHYNRLASWVRGYNYPFRQVLAESLSKLFMEDNPIFDIVRWYKSCDVEIDVKVRPIGKDQ